MTSIYRAIGVVLALLIVANGLLQGAVQEKVVEIITSEEKQEMRNTFYCVAGLMLYPPVKEVWGINIPIPSLDDILITAALTSVILFFTHLINQKLNWKHAVGIFIIIWISIRLMGLLLITISGDDCQSIMDGTASTISSIAVVFSIFGVGSVYKVIKAAK